MDHSDIVALKSAVEALENPGFSIQLANWVGRPVEKLLHKLSGPVMSTINKATTKSLATALKLALKSMGLSKRTAPNRWAHRAAVITSGGVGGMFGIASVAVELPISTTIMLRSIADIARAEGEDLTQIEARLACIEVFALGGESSKDDSADSSYFIVRTALARSVSEAAAFVAEKGLVEEGAPVLVRLIARIAQRFAPQVAEKVAAEAVPLVVGAIGGATVNLIFLNHFQRMAQGHFTVRRLERKYGADLIRREYERLAETRTGG